MVSRHFFNIESILSGKFIKFNKSVKNVIKGKTLEKYFEKTAKNVIFQKFFWSINRIIMLKKDKLNWFCEKS